MPIYERFNSFSPAILGIARILVGVLFICHGAQKLFGAFGGMPPGAPAWIIWTAGTIEFFGGILITLGLLTRITAFIMSGQMAVAYFIGHAPNGFWPTVNGGELAVVYCWFFLFVSAYGPGAFALDNLRHRAAARATRRAPEPA